MPSLCTTSLTRRPSHSYITNDLQQSLELLVDRMQIDNCLYDTPYPIMLYPVLPPNIKALQMSLVQSKEWKTIAYVKCVTRIVSRDTGTHRRIRNNCRREQRLARTSLSRTPHFCYSHTSTLTHTTIPLVSLTYSPMPPLCLSLAVSLMPLSHLSR